MQVLNLMERINRLEDEKWECIMQGAEVKPELQMQMALIDRKLEKLYHWYSKAFMNGLTTEVPMNALPPLPDRRKAVKKA